MPWNWEVKGFNLDEKPSADWYDKDGKWDENGGWRAPFAVADGKFWCARSLVTDFGKWQVVEAPERKRWPFSLISGGGEGMTDRRK